MSKTYEQRRTEIIERADRLAKRVNDNLNYLYKTAPEKAIIAEKTIRAYNRGISDVTVSKRTGHIQVSRAYEGMSIAQIERRIGRVERIAESNRTSAAGFARTAAKHKATLERLISEELSTPEKKVKVRLTKAEGKAIGKAFDKIGPGKFDSETVAKYKKLIKNFKNKDDFVTALEQQAELNVPVLRKVEENPDSKVINKNGKWYLIDQEGDETEI